MCIQRVYWCPNYTRRIGAASFGAEESWGENITRTQVAYTHIIQILTVVKAQAGKNTAVMKVRETGDLRLAAT